MLLVQNAGIVLSRFDIYDHTFDDDIGTVPDVSRLVRARRNGLVLETVRVGGFRLRLMTVAAGDGVFVQVARPLEEVENALRDLQRQVLTFGSLAVDAAVVGAWFLAGRTVRPIVRLTVTAEQTAETGDVDRPVEGLGTGEVGRLARSFRTMLAALSASARRRPLGPIRPSPRTRILRRSPTR